MGLIDFPNTYPLDSDLFGGQRYQTFEQLGPGLGPWSYANSRRLRNTGN